MCAWEERLCPWDSQTGKPLLQHIIRDLEAGDWNRAGPQMLGAWSAARRQILGA